MFVMLNEVKHLGIQIRVSSLPLRMTPHHPDQRHYLRLHLLGKLELIQPVVIAALCQQLLAQRGYYHRLYQLQFAEQLNVGRDDAVAG